MRALAWYSRLEWQAAPRRSGFSRELFGRAWTVWQKLAAEAAPARAVATRLQGGSRPAPWRLPARCSGDRRRFVLAVVGAQPFAQVGDALAPPGVARLVTHHAVDTPRHASCDRLHRPPGAPRGRTVEL